eukprot:CAMPEP_0206167364 /NCGR_PEP_ID=MMETSP1474-20131121/27883_1 /ASSEMBLY_ACC=CAM_ASM_001110 /TAXON_ID=97495 /ORGANISM="Imantonia sp., Strain RCC918" /LENGTH=247 /DNA_ID=CAMNT_0053571965 /DNA_START=77 /DNA_END=817 /DNA_ORIENTATION=+
MAHCGDPFCSDTDNITRSIVDLRTTQFTENGAYTAITVGSDGFPLIAYHDVLDSSLNVASCDDLLCSSSTVTKLDAIGDAGGYPSITVGNDGLPLISFYSEGLEILQLAVCADSKCREGHKASVKVLDDASSDVGRYNYIQIGSDGNPVIMYVDETNGWMKVLHCSTPHCDNGTIVISVIDEIGIEAYGEFPEMQINPLNGLPVLSYFNQTNSTSSNVKIAQCENIQCTSALVQVLGYGHCGYGRDS